LVNRTYADKKIRLDDSCAHCYLKINVEIDAGKIAALDPETVWVQQGGG